MSRKRTAAYQLTESNWDQQENEDEGEEAKEVEQTAVKPERKIKKAVRRSGKSVEQGGTSSNPFQGFSGFSGFGASTGTLPVKPSLPVPPAPSAVTTKPDPNVNFWTNTTGKNPFITPSAEDTSKPSESNYTEEITELNLSVLSFIKQHVDKNACIDLMPSFKDYKKFMTDMKEKFAVESIEEEKDKKQEKAKDGLSDSLRGNGGAESNYTEDLSDLNVTVVAWIQQHVEENPCIDLMPVINDYEKFMTEIEKNVPVGAKKEENHRETEPADSSVNRTVSDSVLATKAPKKMATFSPPRSWPKSADGEAAIVASPKGPGFFSSLATSTPLPTKTVEEAPKPEEGAEEEEPKEKEERKTVVEEDAFFTTRCKLFYKKGSEWQELGMGMLYLKPMDGKTQLLVRMEASTGKILLNIGLSPILPVSRTGKNNLTLMSIPNPPVFVKAADGDNSKPVTYLLRVKGAAEADELYEKIKEHKGT